MVKAYTPPDQMAIKPDIGDAVPPSMLDRGSKERELARKGRLVYQGPGDYKRIEKKHPDRRAEPTTEPKAPESKPTDNGNGTSYSSKPGKTDTANIPGLALLAVAAVILWGLLS